MLSPALKYVRSNSGLTFRPDANTVLWLPGQDDAFSATIRDRSGNGNDGTIVGATWKRTGQGLWYLDYDGNDDETNCGNDVSLQLAVPFTVKVWVNVAAAAITRYFLSKGTVAVDGYQMLTHTSSDNFRVFSGTVFVNGSVVVENTWYHLVMVDNGTKLTLYEQGVFKADANSGDVVDAAGNLMLGSNSAGALNSNSSLALPVIESRAWSAAEVLSNQRQERHLVGV